MKTQRKPGMPAITWAYAIALAILMGFMGNAIDLGPSDVQAERDTEATLQDALLQAQAEHPNLWTPDQVQRGLQAARFAAQYAQNGGHP